MAPWSGRARALETLAFLLLALALTYPIFIDIFRTNVFQTVPRDDYAPYLLHLAGEGGRSPGAPFAYRVLSVMVAVPLYHVVPAYRFSNLGPIDDAYLKATEALALVSWGCLALLMALTYRTARDRFGASRQASLSVMLAAPLLALYTQANGVDPLAMLLIGAAYYWFATPWAFAAIVILSAPFNEKVWIVSSLLVAARVIDARSLWPHRIRLLGCALAFAAYTGVRLLLQASDNEHQTMLSSYPANAIAALRMTFSGKGIVQNVYPVLLCLTAYAWTARRLRNGLGAWSRLDVLVPLGLTAVGIAINVKYTLGRLVLHTIPLILPALAAALDEAGGAGALGPPRGVARLVFRGSASGAAQGERSPCRTE